jgi:rhodanese-related sulfurtransferase
MRTMLATLVAAGVLLLGAAPAAPPDPPANFISVDELKKLIDGGARADLIDVRHWDAFVEMHIKGARSIPVRSVEPRASEISKTGLVVFY